MSELALFIREVCSSETTAAPNKLYEFVAPYILKGMELVARFIMNTDKYVCHAAAT